MAGPWDNRSALARSESSNLADILERVLDKGIVVAGDIAINLVDIELLTIKIRLLVASVDKAREMGIDWWSSDPWLSSAAKSDKGDKSDKREGEDRVLDRLAKMEAEIQRIAAALPVRTNPS